MAECSRWSDISLSDSLNQTSSWVCRCVSFMCIFSCYWSQFATRLFPRCDLIGWNSESRNDSYKIVITNIFLFSNCRFYIRFCCTSTSPLCPPPPLLPVCHCRALSLALGQGEATFSQVELQSASLHQPVRRLQDLRSQGLWLGPLVRALAAPGFGDDTPWGGRCLGLLTDAIQVFHWVFASFTSSGTTTAGKHCYLQSSAANWWQPLLSFARFLPARSTPGKSCFWVRNQTTRQSYFDRESWRFETSGPRMSDIKQLETRT